MGLTGLARRPKHMKSGRFAAVLAIGIAAMTVFATVAGTPAAFAAQPTVGLGTAKPFTVLAGTTVTNTGPSVIAGDLGVSPGSAVTGFPPGTVNNGTQHVADAVALQAQSDLTTAYNDAAGRTPVTTEANPDLTGLTLAPGVYSAGAMSLSGTVTLDAQGDPNAVFIFQAASTLITASSSKVALIGGAQPCNVFWQVTSSATLGTNSAFVGTVMALTSATVQTGATVQGRILARNGGVTLDDNTIGVPACTTAATPTTTTASTTATTSPTVVIPKGAPHSGAGGASHSDDTLLVALGGLALVGAGVAMGQAIRRRRVLLSRDGAGRQG
jgi:Ice-binding-like